MLLFATLAMTETDQGPQVILLIGFHQTTYTLWGMAR